MVESHNFTVHCIKCSLFFFSTSADLKLLLHPRELSSLCSHHHQTKELFKSKSETPAAPGYEWDAHLQHNWYFYLAAFWDSAQVFFVQHRCGHTHMEQSLNPVHTVISLRKTGPTSQLLHCLKFLSSLCEGWAAEKHNGRQFLWKYIQKKMLLYSNKTKGRKEERRKKRCLVLSAMWPFRAWQEPTGGSSWQPAHTG